MKKKVIDREATFALIKKEKPEITFEDLNKKADYYWDDVCDSLNIIPIKKEVIMEVK